MVIDLNVLIVAPAYPSLKKPYAGSFIHEQVKSIMAFDKSINFTVVKSQPYTPLILKILFKKYRKNNFRKYNSFEGVNVNTIRLITLPKNKNIYHVSKAFTRKLKKFIKNSNVEYDIIHSHGAVHTGYAGVMNSKFYNIKSIVTCHGSDISFYPNLNKKIHKVVSETLHKSNYLISISFALKTMIKNIFNIETVKPLYIGIDMEKFKLSNREADVPKKILFIGNVIKSKGVLDLLQAYSQLKNKYNVSLTICGNNQELKQLEDEYSDVDFLGSVYNSDIPNIISNHDILILPSHREGLGLVLLEALSVGRPVLGSNVGGIPEVIKTGLNGYLFEPKNSLDLIDKFELIYKKYKQFTPTALRESISSEFNIHVNSKKLLNIYLEVINNVKEI